MSDFNQVPASIPVFDKIEDLLFELGITPKYVGFGFSSYATYLVLQQPDRLSLITKWLYPDVAKYYLTTSINVERGIRAAAKVAWELRPQRLSCIADYGLTRRPTNKQFIAILVKYIQAIQTADSTLDPIT